MAGRRSRTGHGNQILIQANLNRRQVIASACHFNGLRRQLQIGLGKFVRDLRWCCRERLPGCLKLAGNVNRVICFANQREVIVRAQPTARAVGKPLVLDQRWVWHDVQHLRWIRGARRRSVAVLRSAPARVLRPQSVDDEAEWLWRGALRAAGMVTAELWRPGKRQ